MSNPIDRQGRYRGHLPSRIPDYFVCAECGGQIVIKYYSPTLDDAQCAKNSKHTGLSKKSDHVQSKAAISQQQQVLAHKEVQIIAQSNSQVAELVRLKNKQSLKELFGEE